MLKLRNNLEEDQNMNARMATNSNENIPPRQEKILGRDCCGLSARGISIGGGMVPQVKEMIPDRREYFRKYRQENKHRFRERNKELCKKWRKKNREHCKEYNKKYKSEHREQIKKNYKKWILKNPEYRKEYDRKWYKENPGRYKELKKRWRENNRVFLAKYSRELRIKNHSKRREYEKKWYIEHKENCLKAGRKFRQNNPIYCKERYNKAKISGAKNASAAVARSINIGNMISLSKTNLNCSFCSNRARHYDHRDYNRPLDVTPVCFHCNIKLGPAIPLRRSI
jgi:hypothetical protein